MRSLIIFFTLFLSCGSSSINGTAFQTKTPEQPYSIAPRNSDENSWQYFLQHLPIVDSPIVDYRGRPVAYQQKHVGIIPYDVGRSDLQQCADALMRLRAEYLFKQKKYNEIGFHFVSGRYYSWDEYCDGWRPIARANEVQFIKLAPSKKTHENLRRYLDLVYAYASTISLAKELKPATGFEIGTVVIHPGSPGHCFIIIDETSNSKGEKLYKLAEGYTPAQSIYVLRNLNEEGVSPWHQLKKGVIETASYRFEEYRLGRFE